jgi:hypothetical protein
MQRSGQSSESGTHDLLACRSRYHRERRTLLSRGGEIATFSGGVLSLEVIDRLEESTLVAPSVSQDAAHRSIRHVGVPESLSDDFCSERLQRFTCHISKQHLAVPTTASSHCSLKKEAGSFSQNQPNRKDTTNRVRLWSKPKIGSPQKSQIGNVDFLELRQGLQDIIQACWVSRQQFKVCPLGKSSQSRRLSTLFFKDATRKDGRKLGG